MISGITSKYIEQAAEAILRGYYAIPTNKAGTDIISKDKNQDYPDDLFCRSIDRNLFSGIKDV